MMPSIVLTTTTGWFLPRRMASGTSSVDWRTKVATCEPLATSNLRPSVRRRRKHSPAFTLHADLVPESYRSEALAEALGRVARGRKVLLARADRGRTLLKDELATLAEVDQVSVYQNADAPALPDGFVERIIDGTVDWITLTSSAITERLHDLLPDAARRRIGREVRLASLSPVTSATAAALGWEIAVEATEFTWERPGRRSGDTRRRRSRLPFASSAHPDRQPLHRAAQQHRAPSSGSLGFG